ncbi:MAG: alkaline phosphatase D family protein [Myxococcota bacterium]
MAIDRRGFLKASAAAGLSLPWIAACRSSAWRGGPEAGGPFRHGVASGDPLDDRVILWTRVTPEGDEDVEVEWRLARDPALRDEVARGSLMAHASRDHTVKVDALGLEPGTTYYYWFRALGHASPTGRVRTAPVGATDRLRIAFCSCSNIAFGHFNAYGLIARRADLDAVVHLGDYLYEYKNGEYGDGTELGRAPQPDRELVTLNDYRTRHAQYKRDPDLQELHRQHPFIGVWDDHESANDAWLDGAENHHPQAGEGDWPTRKASAVRAYQEWMPIREVHADRRGRIYRSFRFGDLADLIMLDTRLHGRDRQVANTQDVKSIADPRRSILGREQEAWLLAELTESSRSDVAWRVIGQQVMFAQLVSKEGFIWNPDQWDGYPNSRERVLEHLASQRIDNAIVLTGDIHSSWANDISPDPFTPASYDPRDGRGSLAVELITPGVTSPGIASPERASARRREILERHPHVRWVDLHRRGYGLLDIDRERAQGEWWFVDTVSQRWLGESFAAGFRTASGRNHLERVSGPSPPRETAPALAP